MAEGVIHLGRTLRLDRQAALALLRELGRDRAGMADLRRLLAEELGRASLQAARDEQVITLLAERVATGSLTVALLRHPPPDAPPESQEAAGAAEEPEAAASGPAEEPATEPETEDQAVQTAAEGPSTAPLTLSDLRWSMERAAVGDEVQALFSYTGATAGGSVTIRVLECRTDGTQAEIEAIQSSFPAESGEHHVAWSRAPDGAEVEISYDEEKPVDGLAEHRFVVEAGDARGPGDSGPLWLTNTLTVSALDEESGEPIEGETPLSLTFADGTLARVVAEDGSAEVAGALIGPLTIVANPDAADQLMVRALNPPAEASKLRLSLHGLAVDINILTAPELFLAEDRFVLRSEDGSYRQERSIQDDLLEGDDKLTLRFTRVRRDLRYTLEYVPAGASPIAIFEGVRGDEMLATAA